MPVTAPDRKATFSPSARPLEDASVVRTLAWTDTFMPMNPAAPESTAPSTKPTGACQFWKKAAITIVTATPTMAMVWYCRFRYASAPSRIAAAISCILALPDGIFMTRWVVMMP